MSVMWRQFDTEIICDRPILANFNTIYRLSGSKTIAMINTVRLMMIDE